MGTVHRLPSPSPLATSLHPSVVRMREIAMEAYDTLLTGDGPPHPDYKLLELASEALEMMQAADREEKRLRAWQNAQSCSWDDAMRRDNAERMERWQLLAKPIGAKLRAIGKIRATTPAGIFAKALLVRFSSTAAPDLARSLAKELVECPGLRGSIWPAQT